MRSTFDLSPLFRTAVGFDRLSSALDQAMRLDDSALSYPPYNIEQLDQDHYRITMAVAGFTEDEIEIVSHDDQLTVKGRSASEAKDAGKNGEQKYLYRGIATRAFERHFQLADYVKVSGAKLQNGLLDIELVREVPEAMKPRTIKVESGETKQIKSKAA